MWAACISVFLAKAGPHQRPMRMRGIIPKILAKPNNRPETVQVDCMHRSDSMKDKLGFSAVELLMVVSMGVILAAFSIPMLSSAMRGMKLGSDAKSIATTLTYARISAATKLTRYRLSVDVNNSRWALSKRNHSTNTYDIEQTTNTLSDGISNSGIQFKASSATAPTGFPTLTSANITFDSRGIPMEGAGIIYLTNQNINFAISVSPIGKVQLWRYDNSQWNLQ